MGTPRAYALGDGVRVFRSGEEVRFRKGGWSYNEATLRLAGQGERVQRVFGAVFEAFLHGQDADAEAIAREAGLGPEELNACCAVLDNLASQQYLRDPRQPDATRVLRALLGGTLSGFEADVTNPRPVLFFSDSPYA